MTPEEVVVAFVEAVNGQELEQMVELMTADHQFVDSLGKTIPGRKAMRDAWSGFFEVVPDYRIAVKETYACGESMVIVGSAAGTYCRGGEPHPQNRWQVPAAWRVVVKGGKVSQWQAFVDNEPLRRIMMHCGASRER